MNQEQALSAALLRIRKANPFFATLALFAHYHFSAETKTASTDGYSINLNPDYFASLTRDHQAGLLLHELLHAALQHISRRGMRDALYWNIAADIIVNGIIQDARAFSLPSGAIYHEALANSSVEQVYEQLLTRVVIVNIPNDFMLDLHEQAAIRLDSSGSALQLKPYWEAAMRRAMTLCDLQGASFGHVPAAMRRAWDALQQSRVDWRSALWQFVAHTPCDFSGFDRRQIYRGLYLDSLVSDVLNVYVCVDTSASISIETLDQFASEIHALLGSYPHIEVQLYFADAALYGPFDLSKLGSLPPAEGGGGTSFCPFFKQAEYPVSGKPPDLAVYLTDGDGQFPKEHPVFPVLWVVPQGGATSESFPFGEVIRLFDENLQMEAD